MAYEITGTTGTLITERLVPLIRGVTQLDARDHLGEPSADSGATIVKFPFNSWYSDYPPLVRQNGTLLVEDTDYTTDYINGTVTLEEAMVAGDEVRASYKFSIFSPHDLKHFYDAALNELNSIRPRTGYTSADNVPTDWHDLLTTIAYKKVLTAMLFELQTWRSKLVFPDVASFSSVISGELSMLSSDIAAAKRQAKRRPDPHIVASGKFQSPRQVGENFQQYTVIRGGA